jgi:hypothetical protein
MRRVVGLGIGGLRLGGLGMALLAGTPAAAASYLCRAEVHGPTSGMVATQVVDATGKGKDATLRWFAPHPASKPYPVLMIDFTVPDISKLVLGPVTQATATMAMVMTVLPTAKSADLILTFADGKSVRTPWQLYGVERGPPPPAGAPLHLDVSGSSPIMSGKTADAAQDAAVAKGIAAGGAVRVWVQGDDNSILADTTLDLSPTPERQVQLQDVLGQLRRDAVDPDLSCAPR